MYVAIPIILAIVPALLFVWYYYKQDKQKPEPKGLIIKTFILGVIITLPVIIVELIVNAFEGFFGWLPLLYPLFRAFVVAALCEEVFKLLIVKIYVYNKFDFDEMMDGIVYTIVASLGFACMENILYVMDGGIPVAILRAFTAVPMHALASGMMGYYIGKAKFASTKHEERSLIYRGLWIAILIHGFYDFFLFSMPVLTPFIGLAIFPLLIWTFIQLRRNIKLAIKEDIKAGRVSKD
jgi:RsiW-degrading membrane proteinase PrsW (M82 family)